MNRSATPLRPTATDADREVIIRVRAMRLWSEAIEAGLIIPTTTVMSNMEILAGSARRWAERAEVA